MKTNDLITALAADLDTKPVSVGSALARAIAVSLPVAAAILIYVLHVRSDFWTSIGVSPRFTFKFVFTLATAAAGLWLSLRLSQPGKSAGPALGGLVLAAALLLIAVTAELIALPQARWAGALIGDKAVPCMILIPTLAAAPFAAILFAMRSGAPANPGMAGAAAGLLSGAIGATLYASHCTNDSPLFVAVWYVIALAAITLAGSLIGRKVLRW